MSLPRVAMFAVTLAVWAAPTVAQDLPSLNDARDLLFAEDGSVEWEVIADPAIDPADAATLDILNTIQPQPYYAALALAPDAGVASEVTALAANFHDEENARSAALAACEANRAGAGRPCIVGLVIRPSEWEPGRPLQLSAQATDALISDYRALPRRARAFAISPSTGQFGIGDSRDAAIAACAAVDCVTIVEG